MFIHTRRLCPQTCSFLPHLLTLLQASHDGRVLFFFKMETGIFKKLREVNFQLPLIFKEDIYACQATCKKGQFKYSPTELLNSIIPTFFYFKRQCFHNTHDALKHPRNIYYIPTSPPPTTIKFCNAESNYSTSSIFLLC